MLLKMLAVPSCINKTLWACCFRLPWQLFPCPAEIVRVHILMWSLLT